MKLVSLPTPQTPFDVALVSQLQLLQVPDAGTTIMRPKVGLLPGQQYFDMTLGVPIWWQGGHWVNASGAMV